MDQSLLTLLSAEPELLPPGTLPAPENGALPATPFADVLRVVAGEAAAPEAADAALLSQLAAALWTAPVEAAAAPPAAPASVAPLPVSGNSPGKDSPQGGNPLPLPAALLAELRAAPVRNGEAAPIAAGNSFLSAEFPALFNASAPDLDVAFPAPADVPDEWAALLTQRTDPPRERDSLRNDVRAASAPARGAALDAQSSVSGSPGEPLEGALHVLEKILIPVAPTDTTDVTPFENRLAQALQRDAASVAAPTAAAPSMVPNPALPAEPAGTSRAGGGELQIPRELSHAEWSESFAERVTFVVRQNLQHAELRLNPPQLGQVEVRIALNQDQASVVFSSPHGVVRDAIDAALPRLREALAESGLNLVNVDISDRSLAQDRRHLPWAQEFASASGRTTEFEVSADAPRVLARHGGGRLDCYA